MLSLETVKQNQQDLTATMTARTVLPWFATAPATASPAGAISVRQSLQPYHPQTTAMDHNRLSPIPPSSSSSTTEDSVHNRSSSTQNHLNISLYSNPDSINALNRTYKDKKFVSKAGQLHLPEDPRTWLREDVEKWVHYMMEIHSLPSIQTDRFLMNGKALCLMTIDMFCQRVPLGGKTLYKDFQLRLSQAMYST